MRNLSTRSRRLGALAAGLLAVACGGGSRTPAGPSEPPVPTYSVTATVFYDQNGNGQLDASENARVPGVEVVIGTGTGTSAAGTGVASSTGIREGALSVAVRTESLPAYYQPPPAVPIQVPGGATEVRVPLTLPIGGNKPNLYLGYGDSITVRRRLERQAGLRAQAAEPAGAALRPRPGRQSGAARGQQRRGPRSPGGRPRATTPPTC